MRDMLLWSFLRRDDVTRTVLKNKSWFSPLKRIFSFANKITVIDQKLVMTSKQSVQQYGINGMMRTKTEDAIEIITI